MRAIQQFIHALYKKYLTAIKEVKNYWCYRFNFELQFVHLCACTVCFL
jgi:hypothetical protein